MVGYRSWVRPLARLAHRGRFFALPPNRDDRDRGRSEGRRASRGGPLRLASARDRLADARLPSDRHDIVDHRTPGGQPLPRSPSRRCKRRKHVLCEKPLANSVAEAEAMVTAAAQSGGPREVAFQLPQVPALALARPAGRSGPVGRSPSRARAVIFRTGCGARTSRSSGGCAPNMPAPGALGDLGAHADRLAQYRHGQYITSVGALPDDVRDRAPTGRPASTGCPRRAAPPRPGQPSTTRPCSTARRRRRGRHVSSDALSHRPQKRCASRSRITGSIGVRHGSMNELAFHDATKTRTPRAPPNPGDRTNPPVPGRLVVHPATILGYETHFSTDPRLRHRHRQTAPTRRRLRRRLQCKIPRRVRTSADAGGVQTPV